MILRLKVADGRLHIFWRDGNDVCMKVWRGEMFNADSKKEG